MISAADREKAVEQINEAISNGASCTKACERLGLAGHSVLKPEA